VVAPNFGMACWRPERRKVTGAGDTVAFTMARPPAMNGHASVVYCDVVTP
jgi:hypothetical protein